ncbi:TetR/AcrR family transcriptional regulator [Microbispora sp. NPDC049125]|uniref:TetR/AcrR family transcriptional regulator n=1 Tax=Microbispora sp. NPDC049125 TaxID=3154929 RepID=UPI0034675898
MARVKEFDPDVALQAALELFWERGYEGTSMADLVERLGIGRASLYATFGDKHALYMKALRRYAELRDPSPVETLAQPGPVLPAVRAVLRDYCELSIADARGCLVVNAAAEMLPSDEEVGRFVSGRWAELETALTSALIRARAQGELGEGTDPKALARLLLVLMQGLRVMAKASPEPARLQDATEQALALLK